jgi:hypothetical protein
MIPLIRPYIEVATNAGVFALGLVVDPKPLEACPPPGRVTLIYATGAIANAPFLKHFTK